MTLALRCPPPAAGAPSGGPPGCGCAPGRCRASSSTSDRASGPRPSCSAPSWGLRRESSLAGQLWLVIALTAQPAPSAPVAALPPQLVAMRGALTMGQAHASISPPCVALFLGQGRRFAARHTSVHTAGTYPRKRNLRLQPAPRSGGHGQYHSQPLPHCLRLVLLLTYSRECP